MIKMMITGRRRSGMTVAQLHRYMVEVHGAMVRRFAAEAPAQMPCRYVQNHVFDATFRTAGPAPDTFCTARDFVTQVWFNDPAHAAAALQAPLYREHLQPDEDRFVDQASVAKLPVREQWLLGGPGSGAGFKLFVLWQRAPGVPPATLAEATAVAWQRLREQAGHGVAGVMRNTVLAGPGEHPAADLVDEAWIESAPIPAASRQAPQGGQGNLGTARHFLEREAAARALADRWQALADTLPLKDLLAPGSLVLLLAREKVMFDPGQPLA